MSQTDFLIKRIKKLEKENERLRGELCHIKMKIRKVKDRADEILKEAGVPTEISFFERWKQ